MNYKLEFDIIHERIAEKEKKKRYTFLLSALVEAYKKAVSAIVSETAERLQKHCDQGEQFELAWNKCSVLLVKCAQVSYIIEEC